jgi:PAS domain S-box-containing protein
MLASRPEEGVLILAPTGQDAVTMASLLEKHGLLTEIASSPAACAERVTKGAGALLLTEEALALDVSRLLEALKAQPPWSELPLIILTSGGESRLGRLLDLAASAAGSVTLLERPMSAVTLWRSVEVALLSRRRQYQVRDLLEEQTRKQRDLEHAEQGLRRAKEFDEAVMTNMGEGLYTVDRDGVVTSMNPAAEKLFGWTLQELLGRKMHDLTHYKHADGSPFPAEDCAGLQVLREGRTLTAFEDVFIRKDGTFFDVIYSSAPIREHGAITGLVVVFRDITDRKRAERALQESEERYRTLVSQIKDYAIFRTDRAGYARTWNEGVKRVLGFDQDEFLGQEIARSIFTPEDLEAGVPQRELETAATQGTASNDRWMRRKDGTRFYASGATTALKDATGRLIGFSKVLRDDTEKRQAGERLERIVAERTADLRETNEQLEAFVYSIAHDLRAPLRSMSGFSQLLIDDHATGLDEQGRQLLKRIQASSEFMDKLLVDLLAYGHTSRAELELGPVDVHKAWDSALLQCAIQIEQTRACIETVQPLPAVRAHETTLGQILANLLNNALKFVAPGVQPRVTFRAEAEATFVRLWVEDNGIGIPADQHERVFRVFERLHGSRYSGTGIGLSIVRKGVERMGGTVGLVSAPGHGTRFWIELPKAG